MNVLIFLFLEFLTLSFFIRVRFNEAIPMDLTAVVLAEYSALAELSRSGQISTSYTSR